MIRKLFLFLLLILSTRAFAAKDNKEIYILPIVPNKVADKYVPVQDIKIGGMLGDKMLINLEKRLLKVDTATILSGFKKRPGSQTWLGEHVGKFLHAASNTYRYSHDPRIKELMDDVVKKFLLCQLEDGYLGTYLPKDYWTEWDVWAHKYDIIGLLGYYSVTGKTDALNASKKAADLICRTFGEKPGQLDLMKAGTHVGMAPGSVLEAMVDIYRYTNDPKYLEFCYYITRAYEQKDGPHIISTLETIGDVSKTANGKAYEMMSNLNGLLKLYKLTGEEKFLKPCVNAWNDIRFKRMYITGSTSSYEHFTGDDILPAEQDAHIGEGCVTTTWIQFNWNFLTLTGEAKYVEELERSVYNHLFAAENPKTGCVSYYTGMIGMKEYNCNAGYSCCLSSVPRGISMIPDFVAGMVNNQMTVLLYEKIELSDTVLASDGKKVFLKLSSTGNFPESGKMNYVVNPSQTKSFTVAFRVPAWCRNFKAKIGEQSLGGIPGEYLKISREWKSNSQIEVSFDIPVQVVPGGLSYPDLVAIKRGPQVFAIDLALNPEIKDIGQVKILTEKIVLQNANEKLPADWSWKQAYAVPARVNGIQKQITLVPFADAGQNFTEISVWLPNTLK